LKLGGIRSPIDRNAIRSLGWTELLIIVPEILVGILYATGRDFKIAGEQVKPNPNTSDLWVGKLKGIRSEQLARHEATLQDDDSGARAHESLRECAPELHKDFLTGR
jgi:hypothetical protein